MNKIGASLKKIRTEKRLTLKQVAENVKLSESLLSQIENNKLSPSLQSLQDILAFYAVNLSDFFKQVEQKLFIIQKNKDRQSIVNKDTCWKLTLLASKLEHNTLEAYEAEMNPGCSLTLAILKEQQNGERFALVLEGSVKVVINDSEYNLEAGESFNAKAHVPLVLYNTCDESARLLITGHPPLIM